MKPLHILVLIAAIVLYSCSSELTYEQKVANYVEYVNKSKSSIKEGRFQEAIEYTDADIEITDTVSGALYYKGIASFQLKRWEDAEDNFTKVIEIEGESSGAYRERAKVYLKTGDSDFIDDIETYLEYYPDNEEALSLKRDYLEKKKDFDGAIEEYSNAIAKNKNDLDLLKKRAELYYKNGDYKESVQDYEQILTLDPGNSEIESRKAEILALMNSNSDRNIFIAILVLFYLVYAGLSFFVFKPLVFRKAVTQIGGELEISKDPLTWLLPIVLISVYVYLLYNGLIPNF